MKNNEVPYNWTGFARFAKGFEQEAKVLLAIDDTSTCRERFIENLYNRGLRAKAKNKNGKRKKDNTQQS